MRADETLTIEIEYGYEDFLCEIEKRRPTKEFTAAVKVGGRVFIGRAPEREQAIDAVLLSIGYSRRPAIQIVDVAEAAA